AEGSPREKSHVMRVAGGLASGGRGVYLPCSVCAVTQGGGESSYVRFRLRRAGAPSPRRSPGSVPTPVSLPALPVPLLRDVIARETARSSLRRIAHALAMSPNGLRDFLRGAVPRGPTRASPGR